MWILKWLPDWFFYAVLLIGVVGYAASYLIKFLPGLSLYKTPVQIGSILLVVIGTFMSGASYNDSVWNARVKEMEAKIAVAEEKSKETNQTVVTKLVTKKEYYRQKGEDIIQYVDREIVKYDNQCTIPKEFIDALNKATEK